MKIYIASSWRNQHAVEMLTDLLRRRGHKVESFVENNYFLSADAEKPGGFETWVRTETAQNAFDFDTNAAATCDLVVYLGPSGTDAWAEVGVAWASKIPVYGLWAKGEPAGLMRKMVFKWFYNFEILLDAIDADAALIAENLSIDKSDIESVY